MHFTEAKRTEAEDSKPDPEKDLDSKNRTQETLGAKSKIDTGKKNLLSSDLKLKAENALVSLPV